MLYSIMREGYRKGGRNQERKCHIPRISPPTLCAKAKIAEGGAYLRDTTVNCQKKPHGTNLKNVMKNAITLCFDASHTHTQTHKKGCNIAHAH